VAATRPPAYNLFKMASRLKRILTARQAHSPTVRGEIAAGGSAPPPLPEPPSLQPPSKRSMRNLSVVTRQRGRIAARTDRAER